MALGKNWSREKGNKIMNDDDFDLLEDATL